jgi:hypothetical protein
MDYLGARSRYLQVAGRIGEYYLAEHGGSVYIVFEGPSRRFQDVESLEDTLLHRPLEPLSPGPIYPSILANLMTREVVSGREFKKESLQGAMNAIAKESLRAVQHPDYEKQVKKMFSTLFSWLVKKTAIETKESGFKLSKNIKAATRSGLDIIRYLEIQKMLDKVESDATNEDLVDIVLSFGLPQIIRPRTSYPTKIELRTAGIENPSTWYDELTKGRSKVKRAAIKGWVDERGAVEVISEANEIGQNIVIDGRSVGGIDIDEGDFGSLTRICSGLAEDLSYYFAQLKKKTVADRCYVFSRQLLYGVDEDLAQTDLLELKLPVSESQWISLSRQDARILYDRGYESITDILRKDRDPEKKGLARDRFARNSGLDPFFAKDLYKAALAHVRAKLEEDD